MRINLQAGNATETAILNYLEENASDALVAKINECKKTLKGCINWMASEVRNRAVDGCVMVSDKEAYGMATHYFEEDYIEESKHTKPIERMKTVKAADVKKPEPKKEKKTVVEEQLEGQFSLFDLLS